MATDGTVGRALGDAERRAPVQRSPQRKLPHGSIAWSEHLAAWEDYAKRYGTDQDAEEIARRGGFGYGELIDHLGHAPITWEPNLCQRDGCGRPLTEHEYEVFCP